MKRAILGIVLSFASLPAVAASTPVIAIWYGGDLRKFCNADPKSGEYAMCFSFISAVLEVANNNSIYGLKDGPPSLVTARKAVDLTAKWLQAHPEADIEAASLVTVKALADAFPCNSSN